jgi:hypothetical protein
MAKLSMAASNDLCIMAIVVLAAVAAAVGDGEAAAVEHTFIVSLDYRASINA